MKLLNSLYHYLMVAFVLAAAVAIATVSHVKAEELCGSALNAELANKSDMLVDQTESKRNTHAFIFKELISFVNENSGQYSNIDETGKAIEVVAEYGAKLQNLYVEQLEALKDINGKYGSALKNSTWDGFQNGARTVLSTITFGLVDSYKSCDYITKTFAEIDARQAEITALELAQTKAIDKIKSKPWIPFMNNSVTSADIREIYTASK